MGRPWASRTCGRPGCLAGVPNWGCPGGTVSRNIRGIHGDHLVPRGHHLHTAFFFGYNHHEGLGFTPTSRISDQRRPVQKMFSVDFLVVVFVF